MTTSAVVQFILTLSGSGVLVSLVSWFSGRRKSRADVASLYDDLIDRQQKKIERESDLTQRKCNALIDLCSQMIDDLDELKSPNTADRRVTLRSIERMEAA